MTIKTEEPTVADIQTDGFGPSPPIQCPPSAQMSQMVSGGGGLSSSNRNSAGQTPPDGTQQSLPLNAQQMMNKSGGGSGGNGGNTGGGGGGGGGGGMEYMQTQNHIFVFSTALANKSAEAVMNRQYPSIIAYHCAQPGSKKFLEVCSEFLFPFYFLFA